MKKKYTKILLLFAIVFCVLIFAQSVQSMYADANTTPSAIETLYLHSVKTDQAIVKWSKATNLHKYELTLIDPNGTTRTHIYEPTSTEAVLKNLKSNTQYTVKVRAYQNVQQKQYFNSTTQEWQLTQPEAKDWANKRNRVITVKNYGDYSPDLTLTTQYDCNGAHTGGSATCVARAICTKCGARYGQFTNHVLYFSGKAEDKTYKSTSDINVATEIKTYRCKYCRYTEPKEFTHTHTWDMDKTEYVDLSDTECIRRVYYRCTTCKFGWRYVDYTIGIDDKIRPDNTEAIANAAAMLNGRNKYIGIYANDVAVTQTKYKYGFNTIGWFETLDGTMKSDTKLAQCLEDDMLTPFITLMPNKCQLSDIANGVYDHYLIDFFNRIHSDTRTGPIFVRFAHEMDMRPSYGDRNWYEWQSYDSETFIKAWRHVVDMGREMAPNAIWVWSPNRADKYTRDYYPGSEYVDCVGLSLNNYDTKYGTFEAFYKTAGVKKNLETYGKPIVISEFSCGFKDATKQKNYLTGMINYMQKDPAIVAGIILDSDVDEDRQFKFSDNNDIVYALSVTLGKYKKFNIPERTVDWTTMNPSENKMVTNVQLQTGANNQDFLRWYNGLSSTIANKQSDWSTIVVSWAAQQAGISKDNIPIVDTTQKMIDFFKAKGKFYQGKYNCYPLVGDIIVFDDNSDGTPDRIGLVQYCNWDAGNLVVVGGNMLNSTTGKYVVGTESIKTGDKRIYGYCKPDSTIRKVNYDTYENVFRRDGLDTVMAVTDEAYVKTIADDGIKVMARYINPDGRTPLTKEEAQLFSNYGVRLMMIYQIGVDDPYKGYDKGYEFGTKALKYATDIGAPKGIPIFFCCDGLDQPTERYQLARFIKGVRDAMGGQYGVGMYGPYKTVQALHNAGLIDAVWQCFGYSDYYVSDDCDVFQWTLSTYFYNNIPLPFDANDIKDVEKVSFILPYQELD